MGASCCKSAVNSDAITAITGAAGTASAPGPKFSQHKLNGNLKSVLIGINYKGTEAELRGCENDVDQMKAFLSAQGFPSDAQHQMILTESSNIQPTKANLLKAFAWLVEGAKKGDSLFLHYSGHGTQVADKEGDEVSGYDDAIVPVDYQSAGLLVDDVLNAVLVAPLPAGVRLTCVVDCCHSGTALDLPYNLKASDQNMSIISQGGMLNTILNQNWNITSLSDLAHKGGEVALELLKDYASQQINLGGLGGLVDMAKNFAGGATTDAGTTAKNVLHTVDTVKGEVVLFAGCRDDQTSADVSDISSFKIPKGVGAGGACTSAFIACLSRSTDVTFIDLLTEMRQLLKSKSFEQIPQLSSTACLSTNDKFKIHDK